MEVTLLHATPIGLIVRALRKCTNTEERSDTAHLMSSQHLGPLDKALLLKNAINEGHESVLEHVVFTFDIPQLSRACLQEMARHRIASPSVQSTRFTLRKLMAKATVSDIRAMLHKTWDEDIDNMNISQLIGLREIMLRRGTELKNDVAKYALPEAFMTTMQWTINARSLRNFLKLRTSKRALAEIKALACAVANAIPRQHAILFKDIFV